MHLINADLISSNEMTKTNAMTCGTGFSVNYD